MISFLMSCESKEQEVEKLKTETIAIHDEVMPKMDDIMKLKKELKSKQDSTSNEEVQRLISALEESDKAMMNWMRNYDPRMEDMSDDEKLEYLKSQKSAIQKVKGKMNSSIAEAEDYLN